MRSRLLFFTAASALALLAVQTSAAQIDVAALGGTASGATLAPAPTTVSHQGFLEDGGVPVNDPSATLTFRLYDAASAGAEVWVETITGIVIDDGHFSVELGMTTTALASSTFAQGTWLSTAIGDETAAELSPRTKLNAAPYAMNLATPAFLHNDGSTQAALTVSSTSGAGIIGASQSSNIANAYGVLGQNADPNGIGVYGFGGRWGILGATANPAGYSARFTGGLGVTVEGQVTATDTVFAAAFVASEVPAPVTRHLAIPSLGLNAFQIDDGTVIRSLGGGAFISTGTAIGLGEAVNLPDGAVVTGLECAMKDDSATHRLSCFLLADPNASGSPFSVAGVLTTGASSDQQVVSTTAVNPFHNVIDNEGRTYYVQSAITLDGGGSYVPWAPFGSDFVIFRIKITYEVTP